MSENLTLLQFSLPWPPRILSPNSRAHWAPKSRAAKSYRRTCHVLTLAALAGRVLPDAGRIDMKLVFVPPDRRSRDRDNLLSNVKHGLDGIAAAMGVNDRRFIPSIDLLDEPVKGGDLRVVAAWETP